MSQKVQHAPSGVINYSRCGHYTLQFDDIPLSSDALKFEPPLFYTWITLESEKASVNGACTYVLPNVIANATIDISNSHPDMWSQLKLELHSRPKATPSDELTITFNLFGEWVLSVWYPELCTVRVLVPKPETT